MVANPSPLLRYISVVLVINTVNEMEQAEQPEQQHFHQQEQVLNIRIHSAVQTDEKIMALTVEKKQRMRPADEIYQRIKWDPYIPYQVEDIVIGYEDVSNFILFYFIVFFFLVFWLS